MFTTHLHLRSVTLALATLCMAGSGHILSTSTIAMPNAHSGSSFTLPESPQDPGAPTGRREGGSSRGDQIYALCQNLQQVAQKNCATSRLTALVPATSNKKIWGLTASAHPEFLFYLSKFRAPEQPPTTQLPIEFVLQDEQDRYVFKTRFTLSLGEGGFIRIPIPEDSPPLQVGKRYTWTLLTHFSPGETNYVHGRIYRRALSPQIQQRLNTVSSYQQLEIYLKEGLWFDALSTLLDLRQDAPQDQTLAAKWSTLLQDINLKELAKEPILSCCTDKSQLSLK